MLLAGQRLRESSDTLPQVAAAVGYEQRRRQEVPQMLLELLQSGLAKGPSGAAAQSGEAGTEGGEIGSVHVASIYTGFT